MQANFTKLNPRIPSLLSDNTEIPATTRSLGESMCLNNYGATGSNAAMIISQPPINSPQSQSYASSLISKSLLKYPIRIYAHSPGSLRAYCAALSRFLDIGTRTASSETYVVNLGYNLAHRTNPSLATFMVMTGSSLSGLCNSISAYESGSKEP